jgi:hypothetical protein
VRFNYRPPPLRSRGGARLTAPNAPSERKGLADDENDPPSSVQPRATDFLSEAVERRARAASAIVSGERVPSPGTNPFRVPLPGKAAPVLAQEGEDELGVKLRPTRPPVQPIAKVDLMPGGAITRDQEEILSRLSPPARAPAPEAAAPPAASGSRRTRAVEMPEPGEAPRPRREFQSAEWDRYYNPGLFARAKIPKMPIERKAQEPGAPAWTLVGRPKGEGAVATSRAPYRASLKEGARIKDTRPGKEVARYVAHRAGESGEADLDGPSEVPEEARPDGPAEEARRSEFEAALAELERSFEEARAAPVPPAPKAPRAQAASVAPVRQAGPAPTVAEAAERAMPFPRTSTGPAAARAVARSQVDMAEEDDADIDAEDEEEGTLGRQPPPDRSVEERAHRTLQHDHSGAALCPTCGRRIAPSNPVLVCTSCGRVACSTCGKFSAGQPTGNIYQYEYRFNFPLCQPCFDRHFNIQKNLARSKAYLASGNLTYAFYHAQSARQLEPESPYKGDAEELISQVEARRAQMQKAEKEWDEARRQIMKQRTTVLK